MSGPFTTMLAGRIVLWDPDRVQTSSVFKQAAQLSSVSCVVVKSILGGLHREHEWADAA
jgi:hypothetical protein